MIFDGSQYKGQRYVSLTRLEFEGFTLYISGIRRF